MVVFIVVVDGIVDVVILAVTIAIEWMIAAVSGSAVPIVIISVIISQKYYIFNAMTSFRFQI